MFLYFTSKVIDYVLDRYFKSASVFFFAILKNKASINDTIIRPKSNKDWDFEFTPRILEC